VTPNDFRSYNYVSHYLIRDSLFRNNTQAYPQGVGAGLGMMNGELTLDNCE